MSVFASVNADDQMCSHVKIWLEHTSNTLTEEL